MTGADGLRAYLRLASSRTALDSPLIRLGTLAQTALELAGARVLLSPEAGVPAKPRDDAFSWTIEHDRLLQGLREGASGLPPLTGDGLVLSDDARTVAQAGLDVQVPPSVLWAAPASCLLDPSLTPPAALTLTETDAQVLRDAGVLAVSMLAWPPAQAVPAAPRRVVIAVGVGTEPDGLQAVVEEVRSSLPGRPVIDIVPDAPVLLDGVRHAPRHPWERSRVVGACDLAVVFGRSASTDLVAAEAALRDIACLQVTPSSALSMLPFPNDPPAGPGELRLALPALAQWLVTVSAPTSGPGSKDI